MGEEALASVEAMMKSMFFFALWTGDLSFVYTASGARAGCTGYSHVSLCRARSNPRGAALSSPLTQETSSKTGTLIKQA